MCHQEPDGPSAAGRFGAAATSLWSLLEWLTTLSGKKGVKICVGYFSVNRGKENSQKGWNKRIEKEQEDTADNVLQTLFCVSITCASSGNKSS